MKSNSRFGQETHRSVIITSYFRLQSRCIRIEKKHRRSSIKFDDFNIVILVSAIEIASVRDVSGKRVDKSGNIIRAEIVDRAVKGRGDETHLAARIESRCHRKTRNTCNFYRSVARRPERKPRGEINRHPTTRTDGEARYISGDDDNSTYPMFQLFIVMYVSRPAAGLTDTGNTKHERRGVSD